MAILWITSLQKKKKIFILGFEMKWQKMPISIPFGFWKGGGGMERTWKLTWEKPFFKILINNWLKIWNLNFQWTVYISYYYQQILILR